MRILKELINLVCLAAILIILSSGFTRIKIAENGNGDIPVVIIFVDFVEKNQSVVPDDFYQKITGDVHSIRSYLQEITYDSIRIYLDQSYRVVLDSAASHYSWGYTAATFESDSVKRLALDVFDKLLSQPDPSLEFQDRLVVLILNTSTESLGGRGAMCLVPGVSVYPATILPTNQEMFIGDFPGEGKKAKFIDAEDYPFNAPASEISYYSTRQSQFDAGEDDFVRGVVIFCKDALLSCAVHDVIHAIKRNSHLIPVSGDLGKRARAVPCLYSLYLQTESLIPEPSRSVYCAPFIGWWDNTGDHPHLTMKEREGKFLAGTPYGVSAFTRKRLGALDETLCPSRINQDFRFSLRPLASPTNPHGYARAIRVNLGEDDYLLIEYRYPVENSVDCISVDVTKLIGELSSDPGATYNDYVNPPTRLVSDTGIVIYHINEADSIRQLSCPVTIRGMNSIKEWPKECLSPIVLKNKVIPEIYQFVTQFPIFIYTPSMINTSHNQTVQYPVWDDDIDRDYFQLKKAAFDTGDKFRLEWKNRKRVLVTVGYMDSSIADILIRNELVMK